jgi:hypothetical protein
MNARPALRLVVTPFVGQRCPDYPSRLADRVLGLPTVSTDARVVLHGLIGTHAVAARHRGRDWWLDIRLEHVQVMAAPGVPIPKLRLALDELHRAGFVKVTKLRGLEERVRIRFDYAAIAQATHVAPLRGIGELTRTNVPGIAKCNPGSRARSSAF